MRDALVQTLAVDREACGLLVGKWSTSDSSVTGSWFVGPKFKIQRERREGKGEDLKEEHTRLAFTN